MLNAGKYNKKISIYQVEKIEDASGFKNEKKNSSSYYLGKC